MNEVLKRIPDDVVQYSIYPALPNLDDTDLDEFLQNQADAILAHFGDRLVDYVWQHESFNLKPVPSPEDSTPPHLYGSTNFGDNIDDEWFIVSLLYDITRQFDGCVVRINDNDEEFLLIEAADALPKWLNPETAEKRVFIYNGELHVIPMPESPEDYTKFPMFTPSLNEAVQCVRNHSNHTKCSQSVQNLVNKRLSGFPRKCAENIHHVNCFLPTPLAVLLDTYPSLVSAGVRRFYYRDPSELKACRPMKRFKPDDLTRTRVKMTRCLYAQLVQQNFSPDKRSGWPIIASSNPEFLERDIGMKLAHGFEILCSKARDEDISVRGEESLGSSNVRWQQFKQSLANKGYFKGEIEGSKLYMKLLVEAQQFYLSQVSWKEGKEDDLGQQVLCRLKKLESKFEEFRLNTRKLPPSDDDSWINVTPEQVDEMMKSSGAIPAAGNQQNQPFDLSKIAQSMSAFVDHESGIDGAEFPKEPVDSGDGGGHMAATGMIEEMQKLFDFPEEEDSTGSDMSEYDWSDASDSDDLGSPTKMPQRTKKSSLRKPNSGKSAPTANREALQGKQKSVRFSGPEMLHSDASQSVTENRSEPSSTKPLSPDLSQSSTNAVVSPNTSNLANSPVPPPRPTKRPSVRPSTNPPPVPPRPSDTVSGEAQRKRPLAKPSAVVKPSAPPPPPPGQRSAGGKRDKKLEALMDAMDRELAATDVGKSFEREPKKTPPKRPGKPPPPPANRNNNKGATARDIEDEDDDFRPVNIDLTVIKNTLESYKAQQGLPGPASNILAGFGVKLPDDDSNAKA